MLRHWLNTGIDGFLMDDASEYLGMTAEQTRRILTGIPRQYGNKLVLPEGPSADVAKWIGNLGYTHVYDNEAPGSASADNWNFATRAILAHDASDIQRHLAAVHDSARRRGGGSFLYQAFAGLTDDQQVQEAALIMAGGVLFEIDPLDVVLPAETTAAIERVLRAINGTPANAPGAVRTRLRTNDDAHAFALLSTATQGRKKALNIFNLSGKPATITVDLSSAGLHSRWVRDLLTNKGSRAIVHGTYTVTLPPNGFAMLGVGPSYDPKDDDLAGR